VLIWQVISWLNQSSLKNTRSINPTYYYKSEIKKYNKNRKSSVFNQCIENQHFNKKSNRLLFFEKVVSCQFWDKTSLGSGFFEL